MLGKPPYPPSGHFSSRPETSGKPASRGSEGPLMQAALDSRNPREQRLSALIRVTAPSVYPGQHDVLGGIHNRRHRPHSSARSGEAPPPFTPDTRLATFPKTWRDIMPVARSPRLRGSLAGRVPGPHGQISVLPADHAIHSNDLSILAWAGPRRLEEPVCPCSRRLDASHHLLVALETSQSE